MKALVVVMLFALFVASPFAVAVPPEEARTPEVISVLLEDSTKSRYAEFALVLQVDTIFGGAGSGGWVVREAQMTGPSGLAVPSKNKATPHIAMQFDSVSVAFQRLLFPVKDGTLDLEWKNGKAKNKTSVHIIQLADIPSETVKELPKSNEHPNGAIQLTVETAKFPVSFVLQFSGRSLSSVEITKTKVDVAKVNDYPTLAKAALTDNDPRLRKDAFDKIKLNPAYLERLANDGYPIAQIELAKLYFDGSKDIARDKVAGLKWAVVATSNHADRAKELCGEFEVLMSPEDIKTSNKLAADIIQQMAARSPTP